MGFQVSPGVNVTEIDLTTIVPGVSSTEGAIAGHFRWGPAEIANLVSSEEELVATYNKPDGTNFETFFTAANFLAYGNKLYVSRAVATTALNATVLQSSATAAGSANTLHTVLIKNGEAYDNEITVPGDAAFLAKYPGSVGNSLKISVCDSSGAFESTISNTVAGLTSAIMDVAVGNTDLTITVIDTKTSFTETSNVTTAEYLLASNTASNIASSFAVGDVVRLGNNSIGTTEKRISTIGATTVTGALSDSGNDTNFTAVATLTLETKYTLSTAFSSNVQQTTVNPVKRKWQFAGNFDQAPGTSLFCNNVANNADASDELHIVVQDEDGIFTGVKGQILESFPAVSRASDAKNESGESIYYYNVIANQSRYLVNGGKVIRPAGETSNSTATYTNTGVNMTNTAVTNTVPFSRSFTLGRDGGSANVIAHSITGDSDSGEANVAIGQLSNAVDVFKNAEEIDVSLILQGKARGGTHSHQWANYLIDNIAEERKDCVVIASPAKADVINNFGDEAANTVDYRNALTSSSYGVLDGGYKYQYDRYNDVYRYVPYNGDVAGLIVRTDTNRDPWFSPAGFNRGILKNVIKNPYNPDKADRDILYKSGINPIVTFPGQGTILFGDKTLQAKPSAFDRINVRRLFIVLEKAISRAAKFTLFEFNDEFTRAQFRNLVEPFLRDVQGRRGIFDFKVVCDNTNNTGEIIDRNEFVGDIYIKPARSINFIQLNFIAVRTNVEFSEVVGQF
jgi:hypothetical protein